MEYIGATIDLTGEEDIAHDIIDLAFSIGLSEGYLLFYMVGVETK